MTRIHAKIEQFDGSLSINEESDVFQSSLDATNVIDESDFSYKLKYVENAKVLEARLCALPPLA